MCCDYLLQFFIDPYKLLPLQRFLPENQRGGVSKRGGGGRGNKECLNMAWHLIVKYFIAVLARALCRTTAREYNVTSILLQAVLAVGVVDEADSVVGVVEVAVAASAEVAGEEVDGEAPEAGFEATNRVLVQLCSLNVHLCYYYTYSTAMTYATVSLWTT